MTTCRPDYLRLPNGIINFVERQVICVEPPNRFALLREGRPGVAQDAAGGVAPRRLREQRAVYVTGALLAFKGRFLEKLPRVHVLHVSLNSAA